MGVSLSNALLCMDANDPPKTLATMQLIGSIFQMLVPQFHQLLRLQLNINLRYCQFASHMEVLHSFATRINSKKLSSLLLTHHLGRSFYFHWFLIYLIVTSNDRSMKLLIILSNGSV